MRIHEDLDPDPEPWFRAVISLNLERPTSERTDPEADLERSRLRRSRERYYEYDSEMNLCLVTGILRRAGLGNFVG